jgi:hypothetical protein
MKERGKIFEEATGQKTCLIPGLLDDDNGNDYDYND